MQILCWGIGDQGLGIRDWVKSLATLEHSIAANEKPEK
jgi:hypothetical protein